MTTIRISPRAQVMVLYLLAGIWNAIWLTGRAVSKGASSHHIAWGIVFLLIPPVYLYLALRFPVLERQFIKMHPFLFYGAFGLAFFPWIIFCILIFCLRP